MLYKSISDGEQTNKMSKLTVDPLGLWKKERLNGMGQFIRNEEQGPKGRKSHQNKISDESGM